MKIIVGGDDHIEGEHIRCLQLGEGEELDQLVQKFQSANAVAIIFVNTRDDFMVEGLQWLQESDIPILLLKSSDGKKLLTILGTDVFGEVVAENHVDTGTEQPNATLDENQIDNGTEFARKKITRFSEVKCLLLNNDTPVIVSEGRVIFRSVMSTFQQYQTVSGCKFN